MPLKYFKNKETGEVIKSLKQLNSEEYDEVITAPNSKFQVSANEFTGTSKLKDSDKILRERSRNHARNVDLDETIQFNKINGLDESVAKNLLNSKGQKRTKLDDL